MTARPLALALMPALDLSLPPDVAARRLAQDLTAALGEPATGDDLRGAIAILTAARGELAALAGAADLTARADGAGECGRGEGRSDDVSDRMTDAQRRLLANLAAGREASHGLSGRSAHGALTRTIWACGRRGWVEWETSTGTLTLTSAGASALAEAEKEQS